jgi:DNA-binding FrmR family transcriptional regulator
MTKNNITTIEGLAQLIHETMASKEDIKDVREDITTVNGRLDRIEHLLIEEQRRNISPPHFSPFLTTQPPSTALTGDG